MRTILFTIFLLSNAAKAQIGLSIFDETERGFFVGVNGFLQNGTLLKSLYISDLDTVPTILTVWQDSVRHFKKTIHLSEKGDYKYVLTENSRGKLQLRYRGEGDPPTGAVRQKVERVLEMEEQLVFSNRIDSENSSNRSYESSKTNSSKISKESIDKIVDTATITYEIEIVDTIVPQFYSKNFLQELRDEKFEFERINKSLLAAEVHLFSISEIVSVLEILKYDQTRLQFLQKVIPQKEKWDNTKILYETLDYEMSQETLKRMLNEN